MSRPAVIVGVMVLIGTSLAACNRNSGDDVLANDPFAARSTAKEDQFGKKFGEAFRAPPNAEPVNVGEGDVIPVSNTAEPVDID